MAPMPRRRPRPGKTCPLKPRGAAEIAAFKALWHDPSETVATLARRYGCGQRSIQIWARQEFGLEPRPLALRRSVAAAREDARMTLAAVTAPLGAPGVGTAEPRVPPGPLEDPEIAAIMADLQEEARRLGPGSDMASINRKLARLSLLLAAKAPAQTWESLEERVAALSRATIWMRKVEAELPAPPVDQQQLRREAATQMMKELKSVATAEEERELATLMKRLSDRLIADRAGKAGAG